MREGEGPRSVFRGPSVVNKLPHSRELFCLWYVLALKKQSIKILENRIKQKSTSVSHCLCTSLPILLLCSPRRCVVFSVVGSALRPLSAPFADRDGERFSVLLAARIARVSAK